MFQIVKTFAKPEPIVKFKISFGFFKMSNFLRCQNCQKNREILRLSLFFLSKRRDVWIKSKIKKKLTHYVWIRSWVWCVKHQSSSAGAGRLSLVRSVTIKSIQTSFFFKTFLKIILILILLGTFLTDPRFVMSKKISFFGVQHSAKITRVFKLYFFSAAVFFCEMTAWNLLVLSQLLRKTQSQKTESQYCPSGGLRPNWELLIWEQHHCVELYYTT